MLEIFPEGFEEAISGTGVELAAYTDARGEEQLWQAFGVGEERAVPSDWETRWQRFHRPITVGRLWVGPPWEPPAQGLLAVVIEPGRAFGTGSHATTRLCLEAMQDLSNGSFVDVGCGSGVLAIGAARLGFGPVTAVDSDPLAVEATKHNATANGVEIDVRLLDALNDELPLADAGVANITLEGVESIAPRLRVSQLVTSGYLAAEEPDLRGYERLERRVAAGWAADLWSPHRE
jgi:ribosomal protein L11 methyltransferase